ncbi:MAG: glycosyltransferase [Bacteroidia bacterium]|nr:glycosyltransferase [Bacteroidia bacterium]MCF8428315.1 glycosyltransferase [Bacteroidia bacterium]MCF8447843.1 glycosyltransferase [Bacteroidia bacterium]
MSSIVSPITHIYKPYPKEALFSILIPSWNNLPYLKLCIEGILKNSKYKHQIIIHVNEGKDGTLEWVQQTSYSYTHSLTNEGVCHGLNAMSKLAETNYILYLNDDMFVGKNWDDYLYQAIQEKGDEYFYYSGTMVEYEDTGNPSVLSPYNFGTTFDTFDENAFNKLVNESPKKDWFGACWPPSIVHKRLWDYVNGYDVDYSPGFYSDPDFAMKLWEVGVRDFRGIGKSLVYHFKCKSTGRVVRNNGRKTFAKKWGFSSSFLYKNVLLMGQLVEPGIELKMPSGLNLILAKIKGWYIAKF